MKIQPTSFIEMVNKATTVEQVNHIFSSVDYLFGFQYSPEVESDDEWIKLMDACNDRKENIVDGI